MLFWRHYGSSDLVHHAGSQLELVLSCAYGGLIFCICEYTHAHTLHVHILVITILSFLSISIVTFCCHTQSFCHFHTRAFMSLGVISALRTSV